MRKYKFVSIRKFGIFTLTFALVVSTAGITFRPPILKTGGGQYIEKTKLINELVEQGQIIEKVKQKPKYNLNLTNKYQDLIWKLCEDNGLSYELVLAVAYQESKFNLNARHINRNGSIDIGLFEINNRHLRDYEQYARLYGELPEDVNFDVSNPEHNIRAAVGGLTYFKKYYEEKGVNEEELTFWVLGAYHEGVTGFNSYTNKYNVIGTKYANSVLSYKYQLEQKGELKKGD